MDQKFLAGPESIALHLKGRSKDEILNELFACMARTGKVGDPEAARKAVFEREKRMSTGMQNGVAIPHGKTDGVSEIVAVLGVSDQGVDFDALDGKASRIFVLTLSPASWTGQHLRFMADIGLCLENGERRAAILAAKSPEEVLAALA
jgi:mannitol/fructose-specific phosphotransferase system IIA component (Ntr-type)